MPVNLSIRFFTPEPERIVFQIACGEELNLSVNDRDPRIIESGRLYSTDLLRGSSEPRPGEHLYLVRVSECTREQADQVMTERLGPDEDYGFDYRLGWTGEGEEG